MYLYYTGGQELSAVMALINYFHKLQTSAMNSFWKSTEAMQSRACFRLHMTPFWIASKIPIESMLT